MLTGPGLMLLGRILDVARSAATEEVAPGSGGVHDCGDVFVEGDRGR